MIFIISLNHATCCHIQSDLYIWSILQWQINRNNSVLRMCVLYMCVMCAHVCEGSYTHVCKKRPQEDNGCPALTPFALLSRHRDSRWTWNRLVASKSQYLSVPFPTSAGAWIDTDAHTLTPGFSHECWGFEFRSPACAVSAVTHWVRSSCSEL